MVSIINNQTTELLPCPFCGAFAQVLDFEKVDGDQFFKIQCSGKNCAVNPRTKGFGTLEEAIAAWNSRAELGSEREKTLESMLEAARDDHRRFIDNMNEMIEEEVRERLCAECAEGMGCYADSLCDPLKHRIAELEKQRGVLLRCLENDWHIHASWDGLRRFWHIGLTEEGVRLRDAESNSRAERTCNLIEDEDLLHCSNCGGAAAKQSWEYWIYCPNCGAKAVD